MTLNILAELKENFFIDLALLLIIGILGGKAAEVFRLPKATGYILLGILFGFKAVKETNPGVNYLGFMMILQGAVALDLAILTEVRFAQLAVETGNTLYYQIGNTVLAVVVSIIFSKILGEILVKWASVKAGQTYIEEDHTPHSHLV